MRILRFKGKVTFCSGRMYGWPLEHREDRETERHRKTEKVRGRERADIPGYEHL